MAIGRRRRHRKQPKQTDETTLLPTHLPRGLYNIISAYSAATGISKNALLSRFLEAGFIMYMLGQNTLLETVTSLEHERKTSSLGTSA
jgi:hypothetical protein